MNTDVQPAEIHSPKLPPKPKRSRRLPRFVRWTLILLATTLLSLFLLLLFLNRVGLPEMVKAKIVQQFQQQGWELQFSRLLLGFNRGLVVENLSLHRTNSLSGPQIYSPRAQLRFDPNELKRFQIHLTSAVVKHARIFLPVTHTNQSQRLLRLENVGLQFQIHPHDVWVLSSLNADLLGLDVQLSGTLTNGSALRTWKLPHPSTSSPDKKRQDWLHQILTHAEQFHPALGTTLSITFQGDALDYNSFGGLIQLRVPTITSPWITATNFSLTAQIPPSYPLQPPTSCRLFADSAHTPWGSATAVQLHLDAKLNFDRMFPTNLHLTGNLRQIKSPLLNTDAAGFDLQLNASDSLLWPSNALITVALTNTTTPWARAHQLHLTSHLFRSPTNDQLMETRIDLSSHQLVAHTPPQQTHSLAHAHIVAHSQLPPLNQIHALLAKPDWTHFPIPLEASITLDHLDSTYAQIEQLELATQWTAPRISLQQTARLYQGRLASQLDLNTSSRLLSFKGNSSFDPSPLSSLLSTNGREWLQRYSWGPPPRFAAEGQIRLPPWSHRPPDWRKEVLPSLSVAGSFEVHDGSYRNVAFNSAQSPFHLTNMNWILPNFIITRDEGAVHAVYASDQSTRDFHWTFNSTVDIKAAKPLLQPKVQKGFDRFNFATPPHINGQVWGRWDDDSRLGADLRILATNLTFRGQSATEAATHILYTNQFLTLLNTHASRPQEYGSSPLITVDFNTQQITLTNASGNLNPYVVSKAISANVGKTIEPYQFHSPPNVTVNGIIDARRGTHNSDLHFQINGGTFDWHCAHLEQISGHLHWLGTNLFMTNLQGRFTDGQLSGNARFHFLTNQSGALFAFNALVTNSNLRSFAENIFEKTNHLEGTFSGELSITNALTSDTNSWNGQGNIHLRDGLIWDIPVFGVFSPILNTILPGTGNSRARQGNATFAVSNSVFHTTDMEIHASGMRMQYDGAVAIDGSVQGRMQIEFLRNLPAFGPLISRLFWPVSKLFEFKVDGTIADPQTEPAHLLPKILLLPLSPLKSPTPP